MAIIDRYTDPVEREFLLITDYRSPYFMPGELRNVENYGSAVLARFKGWHLHHRAELNPDGTQNKTREQMIMENTYYYRPAGELVFLPTEEHLRMHARAMHLSGRVAPSREETRQKQSEAKLRSNNTEARYAVVSGMVERGEMLSFVDYAFYRRYCQRNGLSFSGAKVDKTGSLKRVDVPKVPKEKPDRADLQRERFRKIVRESAEGTAVPRKDYNFLRRYCVRNGIEMPEVKVCFG